ncbi:MAG: integrase [Flavobacteriia bacterium]|nr:MAG: integrase [Flavobacteriia bacterium]
MLIAKFIDYLKIEKGYSPHTLLAYRRDLEDFYDFIKTTFDVQDLSDVQYVYVRSWIVDLMATNHKTTSINRKISTLKSFYKFLMAIGQITETPMANHKALKQDKNIVVPFSKKEMQQLFALMPEETFEDVRDKLILELLYATGMRRAELVGLTTKDVDFSLKQIKVMGKREKQRYIPLLDNTINLIHRYLEMKQEIPSTSDVLIITAEGQPVKAFKVYDIVRKNMALVSTKDKRSPHVLRHAFATHLLDEGLDLHTVKELLGHASLASTQVYTHSSLKKIKGVYQKSHPRNR